MSYSCYRRYRRNKKELLSILNKDSSDENHRNKLTDDPDNINVSMSDTEVYTTNKMPYSSAKSSSSAIDIEYIDSFGNDYGYIASPQSSDSDSDEYLTDSESLIDHLASWVNKYNCTRDCTNDLLKILRERGDDLPKDCRTLLSTARVVDYKEKCGGSYLYLGIKNGIINALESFQQEEVLLDVNIDGLPLSKSSKLQLWSILGSFYESYVFVIALFSGISKPDNVNDFLVDFVAEANELINGFISLGNKQIKIGIRSFICDASARSFVKCIIGHNGYFSCERCIIKGTWNSRITFNDKVLHPQRSEEDFQKYSYEDHQVNQSPLVNIEGFPCIKGFPLDYMHLICLGVMKRILVFLRQGPRQCRLSVQQLKEISYRLITLDGKMPAEFSRQPRSLDKLDRWKATEFRQLLLYTGPLVFKGIFHKDHYQHFLALHVAMSILLNENDEIRNFYLNFAKELLVFFVMNADKFYGDTFVVYNVHALLHLHEDAEHFNCSLNQVSAFKFENYMQQLKRRVTNGRSPVAQIAKRLSEKRSTKLEMIRKSYFSTQFRNSCFQHGEKFILLKKKMDNEKYSCNIIKMAYLVNFYDKPIQSKDLCICYVKNLEAVPCEEQIISKSKLTKRVCIVPWKSGFVLLPMLYGDDRC